MILYPAIDLKDGACVRLLRGEMSQATVFNQEPAAQAKAFEAAGFSHLHVVDLNGAFAGRPVNAAAVNAILTAVALPVQLGGGIRDAATAEHWLEAGVQRIVLGTLALSASEIVKQLAGRFPGRIAVGIDARRGRVAVEGWVRQCEIAAVDLARRFEDAGVAAIVYTDIERDGALQGLNVEATVRLAEQVAVPIIASGGVAGLQDIQALKQAAGPGVEGVIIGRALYDGRIDAGAALALAAT